MRKGISVVADPEKLALQIYFLQGEGQFAVKDAT